MIKAREERVRELIRSLESVQVALGKKESAFEGRSFSLMNTGAGKNDAANSRRDASDDIQRAIDHTLMERW